MDIVIEMGLGSCISEWEPIAMELGKTNGVLVYERAGINKSEISTQDRTPTNIAKELKRLLDMIPHEEKLIVIGHSQGGLYASEFCGIIPEMVKGLILLDPLSKTDCRFKQELTPKELKQSGADKSKNFDMLKTLSKLGLKGFVKKTMRQAPPLYYAEYNEEQTSDIINSFVNITHLETCRKEYDLAHENKALNQMISKENYPNIPLILVTHCSEAAINENMEFGRNSREFATRIENMWQDIMKDYLEYSSNSKWIQAEKSTHYIHLMEPQLVKNAIEMLQ